MRRVKQRSKGTGSIYLNSRGQWVAAMELGWTPRGTRRRITFKARTEPEARARLAEAQRRVVAEGRSAAFRSITLKCWADEWVVQRQRTVRPGTFVSDRSAIRRWIIPTLGHLQLDSLMPSDIRKVTIAQEQAGLALPTIQRTHAVIRKMLADAVADGYQVGQRVRETPHPGLGISSRQSLSVSEAKRILKIAETLPDYSRWIAALIQGLRPAEALGLTWEMIDFETATMTLAWQLKALPYIKHRDPRSGFRVPRGFESRHLQDAYHLVRPKTRAGNRVIPLVPQLVDSLREWQGQTSSPLGLVWPSEDGSPRSADYDRRRWYTIAKEAEVEVSLPDGGRRLPLLYEARHTAATLLLANGVDETTIRAILGHSSVISTQSYLHTDQTRTRAALALSAKSLGLDW